MHLSINYLQNLSKTEPIQTEYDNDANLIQTLNAAKKDDTVKTIGMWRPIGIL